MIKRDEFIGVVMPELQRRLTFYAQGVYKHVLGYVVGSLPPGGLLGPVNEHSWARADKIVGAAVMNWFEKHQPALEPQMDPREVAEHVVDCYAAVHHAVTADAKRCIRERKI